MVIVIHEIFGLSDWIRGVADQLASEGFIAVAPDLISGKGPNGGGTDSVATRDDVVKLVRELTPAEVDVRLNAIRAWATALPAASGKSATVGFCWGGGTSFRYATAVRPERGGRVLRHRPRTRRRSAGCRRPCWGSTAATTPGSHRRWRRPTPR